MVASILAAVLAAGGAGCWPEHVTGPNAEQQVRQLRRLELLASATAAPVGQRIAIALVAVVDGPDTLVALQGQFRFDTRRLRYVGQNVDSARVLAVNISRSGSGELRLAAVDGRGLDSASVLVAFEVLEAGYASGLRFEVELGVTRRLDSVPGGRVTTGLREAVLPGVAEARIVAGGASVRPVTGVARLVPDSLRRYGDQNNSGTITVGDAAIVANIAVGNIPAPPESSLTYRASNVQPNNLPGLGGSGDVNAPGWSVPACTRAIDVFDAAEISNEAVGNNFPVAGELIPAGPSLCGGMADSTKPAVPPGFFAPRTGATAIAVAGDTSEQVYRDLVGIRFDDSTSGAGVRNVLSKYAALIVGGIPLVHEYVVRIPDTTMTWDSLSALIARIGAEPGVDYASGVHYLAPIKLEGRYPNDGPASTRTLWFGASPNNYIWPRSMVRLPLAWGCETGAYGGVPTKVAVVDWYFDTTHPDLEPNRRAVLVPPDSLLSSVLASSVDTLVNHGTGVAGIVTAVGDNETAVAGVAWRTGLYLFPLTSAGGERIHGLQQFVPQHVIPAAIDSGVRVLVMSLGAPATDTSSVTRMVRSFQAFIHAGGLIILPAGNSAEDLNRATLAALPSQHPGQAFPLLLVAAARIAGTADSVGLIVVSGVTQQRVRWTGSNYLPGVSDLAAPAAFVGTLAHRSTHGVDTATWSGTSFAAPFVAGAAALLWQMDPTLTSTDVYRLLHEGTLEPHLNPRSGQDSVPGTISNMAGVRLLDVYGSLKALSRQRTQVPVCGLPVRVGGDGASVVLERDQPESLVVAGAVSIQGVTVAQGGRLIGLHDFNGSGAPITRVVNHTGAAQASRSNTRWFLERDTAEVIEVSNTSGHQWQTFTVHYANGSSSSALNPFQGLLDDFFERGFGLLDPSATTLAIVANSDCASGCRERSVSYVVPVANLVRTQVAVDEYLGFVDEDPFQFGEVSIGWAHDGRAVAFLRTTEGISGGALFALTKVTRALSDGTHTDATVNNRRLLGPRFSADDSLLVVGATDTIRSFCQRQFRAIQSPFTLLNSATVTDRDCVGSPYIQFYPNLRQPLVVASGAPRGRGDLVSRSNRQQRLRRPRTTPRGPLVSQAN